MVLIRKLQEGDVDGICALWQEFARLREGQTQSKILNEDAADYFFGYATGLLHRKDTLTLVAVEEGTGKIVGYLIATKQRRPPIYHHTKVAYLSDAYVTDGFRRQGILKRFIGEVHAWARNEGITAVDVQLFQGNPLAVEVYRKLGFRDYRVLLRQDVAA